MEVIRAEVLGYCMGVRRAVETAENAIQQYPDKNVFTLGPLIHNPAVLSRLKDRGVGIIDSDDLSSVKENSVVIIRAHGTTPSVLAALHEAGASVLDATCPRVHLSQKRAGEFYSKGYQIILAGDRNHGEVVSISSYTENHAIVIESSEEAESLELFDKCVLIAQTTFSPIEFEKITSILKRKNQNLQVFNSICSATMERQNALKKMEGCADGILVIGGKTSANTRRLFESACRIFNTASLIEYPEEIPDVFFSFNRVALTAGASTPDSIIKEVEDYLLKK